MLESSFSRVRFVFLVQGNDWSNVVRLIFKSSIRFLGSGQRLIECWKAHFQEFDSFTWFRAMTDRVLESSFSRVRFVFLVQGNDWSNVGKLIFKSSIRFLGSGQGPIECWKTHFQEFDSFSWFRARTDRMLESSFSRVRFVYSVQGNDWSNVGKLVFKSSIRLLGSGQRLRVNESNSWKRAFQHSIGPCPEPRKRIELLKMSFPTFDIFKSSIRFLGSGQRLIECWKAHFQEFDSFSWFRATTDRMLESSFSRVRFVFLVQGKDWSSVGKLVFKSSIRFLGSGQRLIECWKAHFQEFDSFIWFRATTEENESNSWKRAFQHSISPCPEPRKRIELLKMSFPTFDQLLPWTKKTNRTLENELSNIRSVVALNQINESNSWKWAFQHSISRCPEPRKRIELLKMSFPTFDQSLPWTKKTNRTLENELSNARSVLALNQENESNSWKWAFQRSISRCPEPSNVGKLIFKSSIHFLGSGQWLIERWKARFQEFDSFSWFRATTDRALESSFSRVRFVSLVQGNDWSSVGKLIFKSSIRFLGSGQRLIERWKAHFKSSIRFLGSGQRLIECWKAHFQEFDSFSWFRATTDRMLESSFQEFHSFSWFRATTDRMLESSFSRVRFVFLVQGNDWSNVGKLVFKSSICFLGSGQRLIECWKARFQEFDSFFLVQGNDWSNVGKLVFKSSIRFLGSGQRLIECWKTRFQEFDSFSWFRATTDRMLESSFSRVRFVYLVQGNDWSNVGKLIFKSSIRFLGSGQRLIECWKARFQEFDSFTWFRARTDRMLESSFSRVRFVFLVQGNDRSNVGKLVFKSSIRFLGSGQGLIECWKAHFQEFDSFSWFRATTDRMLESSFQEFDSFTWFRATTDRMLENSFSRVRFVFLVQGNDWSNVGKLVFKSSIRFLGSGQRLIECWKARFQEFDSFSWFRATTDRALESSFSRVRFVFLVQGNDWSSVGKLVFKSSIRFLGSGQGLIKCWKAHFQEFDSFSWFRATTDRMLESSFSRVRLVYYVQGNDWSNVGKLIFKSSIHLLGSGQRLIERWKARFQEFDSFSWFRARTDRMLESSIFKNSIRFLGSGQRPIECWKARFQEFDSFSWFRATTDRVLESSFSRVRFVFLVQGNDWSNVGKLVFECWKADRVLESSFQEFDSFSWFRATTDRMLESSFSRVRFVFLVQGKDWSNVGKLVFKSSIRFLGSGQRLIECWKARFQEFDSFSWFRAMTDRMLESSFSRVRFVFLVQGKDWSNVGKLIFKS